MTEPMISLVVATRGRVDELGVLLASLRMQQYRRLEIIVVDQNADDRLLGVLEAAADLPIRHVRAAARGLSYARNIGIGCCGGDIVGFPDDDCYYPDGVLAAVAAAFAAAPELALLSGAAHSPNGRLGSGRWSATGGPITRANVFTTVISFNLFLRADLLRSLGGFDERLGIGAKFGSCEETELVIRAIAAGATTRYQPQLLVIHPDKRLSPIAVERAFAYGTGLGYVLRRHRCGWVATATYLIRPFGGMVVYALRANRLATTYYWRTLRGRIFGYLTADA
ncbi:MAG: glycosyltransferase [Rhodospirillales bacterium]|nr:glycosyltransferase [Rhodospirillales bacterium]MDE2197965.1 glycosyltransferase [Rhodospirillales bacterium]MDE2576482.1 glycosyltransferase [Rhodospirillales bacterium]